MTSRLPGPRRAGVGVLGPRRELRPHSIESAGSWQGPGRGCFAQVGSLGCLGPGGGVPGVWGGQLWVRVRVEWGSEPLVTQGRGGVCREWRGLAGP